MGFIHYNCTVAEQAAAVAKVKAHIPGFVVTPVCMKPTDTVSALDNLKVRLLLAGGLLDVGTQGQLVLCKRVMVTVLRLGQLSHLRDPSSGSWGSTS